MPLQREEPVKLGHYRSLHLTRHAEFAPLEDGPIQLATVEHLQLVNGTAGIPPALGATRARFQRH
jgi:hypothetical protein